jgi:hypothetical protein
MQTILGLPIAALLVAVCGADFGYQAVKPQILVKEQKDIPDSWILSFEFRGPRFIPTNVPGKGRKLVWYMTYKVSNRTPKPRLFIPHFTLVTDTGKVYHDVVLPQAEKAVIAREDPIRPLLNSVTIADELPPTPSESQLVERHGVCFFEDVDPKARQFTVYVTGLSNLYLTREDDKTKAKVTKRKTLQLDFLKQGDEFLHDEKEIRFAGYEWTYR